MSTCYECMKMHEVNEWIQCHVQSFSRNPHAFNYDFDPVRDGQSQHKAHKHNSLEMEITCVLTFFMHTFLYIFFVKNKYAMMQSQYSWNQRFHKTGCCVVSKHTKNTRTINPQHNHRTEEPQLSTDQIQNRKPSDMIVTICTYKEIFPPIIRWQNRLLYWFCICVCKCYGNQESPPTFLLSKLRKG